MAHVNKGDVSFKDINDVHGRCVSGCSGVLRSCVRLLSGSSRRYIQKVSNVSGDNAGGKFENYGFSFRSDERWRCQLCAEMVRG